MGDLELMTLDAQYQRFRQFQEFMKQQDALLQNPRPLQNLGAIPLTVESLKNACTTHWGIPTGRYVLSEVKVSSQRKA